MNMAMTTTAFEIDGYRIVKTFGVVRGITVRSRSVFGNIGASFQQLVGGNISLWTELCDWYIELAKPALYDKSDEGTERRHFWYTMSFFRWRSLNCVESEISDSEWPRRR